MSTVYYAGPYDPSRGYGPGALVQFSGHTYVCTAPVAACHKYSEDDFTGRALKRGWGTASDGRSLWTLGDGADSSRLASLSVKNGLALVTYDGEGNLAGTGNFWLTFGAVQSSAERDLLIRFRFTQAMEGGWVQEFVLHATPDWDTAAPDCETDVDNTFLSVYNGGDDDTSAARDPILQAGTWYDQRLRCASPLFAARTWATGTAEPETWDASVSDAFTVTPGLALAAFPRDSMPAGQQVQVKYIAQLAQNPTPDLDTAHFDPIA